MFAVKNTFFRVNRVSKKTEKKNNGFLIFTISKIKELSIFSNAELLLFSRSARIIIINAVNVSINASNTEVPKKMNHKTFSLVFNKPKIFLLPINNGVEPMLLGSFESTFLIDVS